MSNENHTVGPTPDPDQTPKNEINLNDTMNKCLLADGFVVFTAVLTAERDPDGRRIIKYEYQRSRMSIEDTNTAAKKLTKFVEADLKAILKENENEG